MISGKKVLVTGADGFIGSHLTEFLLAKGYEVRALCYYNSFNYWGWLEGVRHPGLEIVCGDVRDAGFCRNIVKGVDTIYHLAALIAIPYSYQAPDNYIDTNVKGTLNICQAARDQGVGRVLITSTSEVYGTACYVPIDEKHPRQPQSPYSASKIGADALALSFYKAFDLPVTVVRPFNTYGPRQSARAIIPSVITQILAGRRELKVGDLTPTRDFNFVLDTARGFWELAQCEKAIGEEVNICSNFEITIGETIDLIVKILHADIRISEDGQRLRPAKSEVFRLFGDNSKIKALTGFRPEYDMESGLRATIDWFQNKENQAKYKADIYNV